MESLQYVRRQGIPLRGKEEGNQNFIQLLLLHGKNHLSKNLLLLKG